MLIEEKALKHWIDNFCGYGSWHARFWFIGYEESGGEVPEEVAEKINYFYKVHAPDDEGTLTKSLPSSGSSLTGSLSSSGSSLPGLLHSPGSSIPKLLRSPGSSICDIRELYRHVAVRWDGPKAGLYTNRYEYRFGSNAIQHGVWKNLIAFVHGYKNEKLPDLLAYQKYTFASPSEHNEALIPLYPLPSPHNHAWYYSWLDLPQVGFLKSRTLYEEHVYQRRMHSILSNISTYKPEVVLMYGMNNINTLKKSVQEFFHGAKFKMIKAIKRRIPQHHRADLDGTTMLITTQIPALRHNRIETGFDWEEFGKRVKSETSN